jgi:hypothetical protein
MKAPWPINTIRRLGFPAASRFLSELQIFLWVKHCLRLSVSSGYETVAEINWRLVVASWFWVHGIENPQRSPSMSFP